MSTEKKIANVSKKITVIDIDQKPQPMPRKKLALTNVDKKNPSQNWPKNVLRRY